MSPGYFLDPPYGRWGKDMRVSGAYIGISLSGHWRGRRHGALVYNHITAAKGCLNSTTSEKKSGVQRPI